MQAKSFALAFLIFSDFLRVFCRVALPFTCVSDVTHAHAAEYQPFTPTPPAHAPEGRSTLSNNFFYFFLFSFSRLYPPLVYPILFLPFFAIVLLHTCHCTLYIIPYLLISFAFKRVLCFLYVFACLVLNLPLFFILSPTTMSHHHVPHPLLGSRTG